MGILTDLFVADPKDADTYEALQLKGAINPERFDRAEFKGLTDLNFGILWAIIEDKDWDPETHSLETISLEEPGETWLFRFPAALVSQLSSLDSSQVSQLAEAWAATEELRCQPSDIEPVVRELVRLANVATRDGKGLYLWGSL